MSQRWGGLLLLPLIVLATVEGRQAGSSGDPLAAFIAAAGGAKRAALKSLVAEGRIKETTPLVNDSPAVFRFVYPGDLQLLALTHPANADGPLSALTAQENAAWFSGQRFAFANPVVSGQELPLPARQALEVKRSLIEVAIGAIPDRLVQAGIISLKPAAADDKDHVALDVSDRYGPFGTLLMARSTGLPASFKLRFNFVALGRSSEVSRVTTYGDFRQFDGVTLPTSVALKRGTLQFSRHVPNGSIAPGVFKEPTGSTDIDELVRQLKALSR